MNSNEPFTFADCALTPFCIWLLCARPKRHMNYIIAIIIHEQSHVYIIASVSGIASFVIVHHVFILRCMYVCMYVCKYVLCIYVYVCMYVCMYVPMSVSGSHAWVLGARVPSDVIRKHRACVAWLHGLCMRACRVVTWFAPVRVSRGYVVCAMDSDRRKKVARLRQRRHRKRQGLEVRRQQARIHQYNLLENSYFSSTL